jgi:transcriptional regulator with XRE-family HTH domain
MQEEVDMQIGKKIKDYRQQNGLTLQQLSNMSGVSIGLLSQIERGVSSSSIHNIQKITKSLGVSFAHLFNDIPESPHTPDSQQTHRNSLRISVVKAKERKKLLMPFGGYLELLAPVHNHKIEFIYLKYPVGAKVKEPFTHDGEECGLVLEGTFKVTIGDQEFILQEGDSIYFDSTIPHSWENIGDTEVKFVSALTPPSL